MALLLVAFGVPRFDLPLSLVGASVDSCMLSSCVLLVRMCHIELSRLWNILALCDPFSHNGSMPEVRTSVDCSLATASRVGWVLLDAILVLVRWGIG